jgi:Protein of unknown function (DUF998)
MGSRSVPAFVPYLAAVAGVTYGAWVLGFVLNPRLDAVNGYVSELSASDQPYHYVFAGGDFVAGALAIAVAGTVLLGLRRNGSFLVPRERRGFLRGWEPVGWFALLSFGGFVISDALFAMDCAPNTDTTCALRERAGRVSFAHEFHLVTSACAVTAGIVSVVALAIAARRGTRLIARWSWPVVVAETGTALATLPLMYFGVLLGVIERIQVSVVSLWLFVVAGELRAQRPTPAGRAEREKAASP